jgi:hypothetical protein
MLDANTAQQRRIKILQTRGVAGMAGRLATSINSITQAALGESAAATKDTISRMNDLTLSISKDQLMNNAVGLQENNDDLMKALRSLADMDEAVQQSTDVMSETYADTINYVQQLKDMAEGVKSEIGRNFAVAADAAIGQSARPTNPTAAPVSSDPFKL